MKIILLSSLLFLLNTIAFSQKENIKIEGEYVNKKIYFNLMSEPSVKWEVSNKPYTSLIDLKGQVKSMRSFAEASPNLHKATVSETGLVRSNGKTFGMSFIYKFDKNGYKSELSSILKEGKGSYRYVYEYDSLGNQIKHKYYRPYNTLVYEQKSKYNEFNQIIQKEKYENDTLVSVFKIEYDQENKIATSYFTQIDVNKTRKSVYEFNSDNQRQKLTFYDFKGKVNRYIEYIYNEKGLLIEEFFKDVAKKNSFKTIYEYEKGRLIRKVKYNEYKKIISEKFIEYDKNGKLVNSVASGNHPEEREILETDENGNWIQQSISTLGFIEYIEHREFVYY